MATVIELTAVVIEAFSSVLQVTEDDTVEISSDRVTTTLASGKEVTMEITVNKIFIVIALEPIYIHSERKGTRSILMDS